MDSAKTYAEKHLAVVDGFVSDKEFLLENRLGLADILWCRVLIGQKRTGLIYRRTSALSGLTHCKTRVSASACEELWQSINQEC